MVNALETRERLCYCIYEVGDPGGIGCSLEFCISQRILLTIVGYPYLLLWCDIADQQHHASGEHHVQPITVGREEKVCYIQWQFHLGHTEITEIQ